MSRYYRRVPMLNDLPGLTYECDDCGKLKPVFDRWTDGARPRPICGECASNINAWRRSYEQHRVETLRTGE